MGNNIYQEIVSHMLEMTNYEQQVHLSNQT